MSDETFGIVLLCIFFVPSCVLATCALSKLVDTFCSVNIDATIIRRIEAMRMNGSSDRVKVVLHGMEPEERLRVLERVLDCKPYSKELGAQMKKIMEGNRKQELEDNLQIYPAIQDKEGNIRDDIEKGNKNGRKWLSSYDKMNDRDPLNNEKYPEDLVTPPNINQHQDIGVEMNILDQVWKEFGQMRNEKKKRRTNNETTTAASDPVKSTTTDADEVTETCAICMEDYKIDQDVVIGHNCAHMYHKECLLKWMSAKHDSCPYCRTYVIDVPTFQKRAEEMLGIKRYCELVESDTDAEGGARGI